MGQYISVKETGRRLRVKTFTIRGWIRQLKESDQITYNSYIQTHTHKWNRNLEIYTVDEDFIKELQKRFSTHSFTYSFTHSDTPLGEEKQDREKAPGTEAGNPEMFTQMFNTLSRELEGQRDTLHRVLQDHAEERKRADTLIAMLRGDVKNLNDKLFLLTEGEKEQPPETTPEKPSQDKTPETPGKPEDIKFTFADRLWFIGQDIKRILNKKIF